MQVKKISLKAELIFSLLVKCILLYIIWKVCFAHPMEKHLTALSISQHMIVSTQTQGSS